MIYFVSALKPLSIQAERRQGYVKRLQSEFAEIASLYRRSLPLRDALYSKLIYIHFSRTTIDVDNMSKPFIDAFNNVIYSDDAVINHRICSKVRFEDFSSREIRFDLLPDAVARKLGDLITGKSELGSSMVLQ